MLENLSLKRDGTLCLELINQHTSANSEHRSSHSWLHVDVKKHLKELGIRKGDVRVHKSELDCEYFKVLSDWGKADHLQDNPELVVNVLHNISMRGLVTHFLSVDFGIEHLQAY